MTFVELYNLKNPNATSVTDLKKKVTVAVSKVALAVMQEPGSTPNHEARFRFAKNAIVNAESLAEMMMWAILGNPDIAAAGNDALDADIEWVINFLWNTFAQ